MPTSSAAQPSMSTPTASPTSPALTPTPTSGAPGRTGLATEEPAPDQPDQR
jgi:hypothetical protein